MTESGRAKRVPARRGGDGRGASVALKGGNALSLTRLKKT